MILKSVILGLVIFLVDLIVYGVYLYQMDDQGEKKQILSKIKFTVPIGLFMQIFFAIIFISTFNFLAVLKALEANKGGGLYFAYVLFVPMMYMLFNNWLWGESKKNTLYLNIGVWGFKLLICGIVAPFI